MLAGLIGQEAQALTAAVEVAGATEDGRIKTGDDLDVWEHRLEERVAADTSIADTDREAIIRARFAAPSPLITISKSEGGIARYSSGGVRVSADPQAGIMATENRPTALVDVTIAFVFAATSTTSPLGIHYYAIAFSGVAPVRHSARLAVVR